MSHRDDWKPILEELERRRGISREMGGRERVERLMTARGKLDARARLGALFDPGSFVEFGGLVGGTATPGDALVAGFGKVDGRSVVAAAEDFTVLGGSIGQGSAAKRYRAVELAHQERVPLVFMLDGAGHRLTETGGYGRSPNDLLALADLSGRVPMVCLVLGASAGHGALTSPLSDFTIMSEAGAMFTGGPPLVKGALGEDVTKEELGGPKVCAEIAGTAHNVAKDDADAIALARQYLSYLPSNRDGAAPHREGPDAGPRLLDDLLDLIPPSDRKPYKMHGVLERVVDRGSLFEVQPRYGAALITALAFVGGQSCAIVANNPWVRSGSVDSAAAIKAMDFLETAGRFNLPVIFLADNPGVMAGTRAEREGILKWAGKMFRAERRLRVPKIHVTFRKAFGFGSTTMGHNPFDHQTLQLSFPNLTMSSMPAGAGGQSAKLDAETQARVEAEQKAGAWRMASSLGTDDVIDPRELRNKLLQALDLARERIRNPRHERD
ncbi:MAG TPA: carboxyl transferase domain-containing protein [Myxococcota bacterium]